MSLQGLVSQYFVVWRFLDLVTCEDPRRRALRPLYTTVTVTPRYPIIARPMTSKWSLASQLEDLNLVLALGNRPRIVSPLLHHEPRSLCLEKSAGRARPNTIEKEGANQENSRRRDDPDSEG
jgi:hypothetical protein